MVISLRHGWWWLPMVPLPALAVFVTLVAPQPINPQPIPVLYFASMVLIFGSPYFVHRDRAILAEHTDWTPSKWFYYMPLISFLFPILYVIRRYRNVENW